MLKNRILAIILVISIMLLGSCSIFGGVADEGEVTLVVETSEGYEVHKAQLGKVENKDHLLVNDSRFASFGYMCMADAMKKRSLAKIESIADVCFREYV